jgi:hypothetical protein
MKYEVTWICSTCGAVNNDSSITCKDCSRVYKANKSIDLTQSLHTEPITNAINVPVEPLMPPVRYDDTKSLRETLDECYPLDVYDEPEFQEPKESLGVRFFVFMCNVAVVLTVAFISLVVIGFVALMIAAFA